MRIDIEKACELLCHHEVVSLPTETVYGLAAFFQDEEAIEKIFSLKKRPKDNPLIIHVSSFDEIQSLTSLDLLPLTDLAKAFMPGPLTLVLPAAINKIPAIVRSNLPTAAFRIPSHRLTCEVIRKVGPLVMPSANLSGKPSAVKASHVEADFGPLFPVLDGGLCSHGVESTILSYAGSFEILRLGALTAETLSSVIGYEPSFHKTSGKAKPQCPGQQYRHYAPKAKLHLTCSFPKSSVIVGFEGRRYPENCRLFSLGSLSEPKEIAQKLYTVLRALDDEAIDEAYVDEDFPRKGLFRTIHERLERASN